MTTSFERLIDDTLHERRMGREGSFVWNVAGQELRSAGPGALSEMERAIKEAIEPALRDFPPPTDSLFQDVGPLPGLKAFLGAYLVVGLTSDPPRVIGFLRNLDEVLLTRAIAASGTFFAKTKAGYQFDIAPPPALLEFLVEFSSSSSLRLQKAAKRALAFVTTGVAPANE